MPKLQIQDVWKYKGRNARTVADELGANIDDFLDFLSDSGYYHCSICGEITDVEQLGNDLTDPCDKCKTGIKFTCPSCGSHRLEQCYNGPHKCEITNIDAEGDFDYGDYESSTEPDRNQCLNCGFVITDPDSGAALWDNQEVVEWLRKNCKQEDN